MTVNKTCIECQRKFEPNKHGRPKKFCSHNCRSRYNMRTFYHRHKVLCTQEELDKKHQKFSVYWKGKKQSNEHIARRILSRKIGKEQYAKIKDSLLWNVNSNDLIQKEIK